MRSMVVPPAWFASSPGGQSACRGGLDCRGRLRIQYSRPVTPGERRSRPTLRPFPHKLLLLLALACTLLNAVKPLTIDDTAYHGYAAQVADRPLDPYGFAMYWWYQPEVANEVLAPPLFFYWWSVALRLFGENVFLAKMWLLPFSALLAYAL